MLTKNQFNLLRLLRSENIGSATIHKLLEFYKTSENIINNLDKINYSRKRKINLASEKLIKQELKALEKINGKLVFIDDDIYPENLKNIDDAPFVLSCIGNIDLLSKKQIAIVGSRSISQLGLRFTQKIASELSEKGFVITSGLARGVDSISHKGALSVNGGTIAVLGSSVDFVYPSENVQLYNNIIENNGLIISENPTGSGIISKHQFPRRNRIIAGLSHGVVVTECTKKSGSLITARLGLEMGKDLFACPGHPLDMHFEGTNDLLKQNCAFLLTDVSDILEQVSPIQDIKTTKKPMLNKNTDYDLFSQVEDVEEETKKEIPQDGDLLSLIKIPISLDELSRKTKLTQQDLNNKITMLELEGSLERLDSGLVVSK